MPAPKPALEDWIPKAAAAKLLGVSLRQIERRERDGYIEKRTLARLATESTGRVLYSRADLEALKAGTPNTHARVVSRVVSNDPAELPSITDSNHERSAVTSKALAVVRNAPGPLDWAFIVERAREYAAPVPKPWLTLEEAVEYSGLPRGYLLKRAREGWDAAVDVSTGGAHQFWRFNRAGLGAGK